MGSCWRFLRAVQFPVCRCLRGIYDGMDDSEMKQWSGLGHTPLTIETHTGSTTADHMSALRGLVRARTHYDTCVHALP